MPGQLRIVGGDIQFPSGGIIDEDISDQTKIDADKLQHIHKPGTNFDLPIDGTPVTREEIIFVASTVGVLRGFGCLLADSGSSTDIAFDLKVNGVSVLSAAVNYTDGEANGAVLNGTLSDPVLGIDDIVSITMTVTSATDAEGPFAWCEIQELAA